MTSPAPGLRALLTRGRPPDLSLPWRVPATSAHAAAAVRDVRDGLVQRVVGPVVVGGDVEVTRRVRARALALLVPEGAVVLGEAAAWVHAGPPLPVPRSVWITAARRYAGDGLLDGLEVRVTRSRPPAADVVEVEGLLLSSPARTLVDVARTVPAHAPRVRQVLSAQGMSEGDLASATARAAGRANVRTARRALAGPPAALRPSAAGRTP